VYKCARKDNNNVNNVQAVISGGHRKVSFDSLGTWKNSHNFSGGLRLCLYVTIEPTTTFRSWIIAPGRVTLLVVVDSTGLHYVFVVVVTVIARYISIQSVTPRAVIEVVAHQLNGHSSAIDQKTYFKFISTYSIRHNALS